MKPADALALFALAAIWGGSYALVRVLTPVFGPFLTVEARVLLGGAAVGVYMLALGQGLDWGRRWREYLVLGALNAALPFCLIAFSLLHISASTATVINATSPLFAAAVAAVWLRQRLGAAQVAGLGLGVLGVAVLVGWSPAGLTPQVALASLAMLLAAFTFGYSTVFARRHSGGSAVPTVVGQMGVAGALLAVPALLSPPPQVPSALEVALLVMLGLVATGLGNLMFFRLISSAGPTQASSVGFLVPVFGVLFGTVFLGEPLTWGVFVGMGLILLSVGLVNNLLPIGRAPTGD